MTKYRLMASCSWIANSKVDLGTEEFDTIEEAQDAAWETAQERIDAWAEEIPDGSASD